LALKIRTGCFPQHADKALQGCPHCLNRLGFSTWALAWSRCLNLDGAGLEWRKDVSRRKWWRSRIQCCLGCALHASVRAMVSWLLLAKGCQSLDLELQLVCQEGGLRLAAVPACHPSIHPSIHPSVNPENPQADGVQTVYSFWPIQKVGSCSSVSVWGRAIGIIIIFRAPRKERFWHGEGPLNYHHFCRAPRKKILDLSMALDAFVWKEGITTIIP
jgi:hypothetical protein